MLNLNPNPITEAADKNIPLDSNAFVLKKAIDAMANADLDNVKPMKSGSVFIEVETKQQWKNLLKTAKLLGYLPVKVSPHTEFFKICHWMWGTGYDGRRWKQKITSTTRNHCCQKNIHMLQSVRIYNQRTEYSEKN